MLLGVIRHIGCGGGDDAIVIQEVYILCASVEAEVRRELVWSWILYKSPRNRGLEALGEPSDHLRSKSQMEVLERCL